MHCPNGRSELRPLDVKLLQNVVGSAEFRFINNLEGYPPNSSVGVLRYTF